MTLYKWSQTAASDATADSTINWAEGQAPSSINDSARAMMAATAKYRDDIAGAIVAGGTSTAYTVSSYQVFDTLAHLNGQMIAFTPHTTNGATVTLNVDSLGAKPLRTAPNTELLAGTIIQGTPYVAVYNNTDGAWYLQGFFGPSPYLIPLGGMMDYVGTSAPSSQFAMPYGQAISRATYATLWAMIGTTFGNGDGSTTFNIPDLRGRVIAGADNMGGSAASRLTSSYFGEAATLGAVGGGQAQSLNTLNLPPYAPSGTVTTTITGGPYPQAGAGGGAITATSSNFGFTTPTATSTFIGNPQGGTSTPFATVQPTMCLNKILRIA